jgi:hypothetical protein
MMKDINQSLRRHLLIRLLEPPEVLLAARLQVSEGVKGVNGVSRGIVLQTQERCRESREDGRRRLDACRLEVRSVWRENERKESKGYVSTRCKKRLEKRRDSDRANSNGRKE